MAGAVGQGSLDLRLRPGEWPGSIWSFGRHLGLHVEGHLLLWEPDGWDPVSVQLLNGGVTLSLA